ncbi:MAG: hypothetical protein HYY25_06560 [Candidatus Wallbacteria bacterium]|nr:hypothetical protein [Candidatus Wallbacteria bacterium]
MSRARCHGRGTAPRPADKSGAGTMLALVTILVLVLATTGFSRLTLMTQAGTSTHRSVRGDMAMLAAESAVEEMATRLRAAAADPRSPLFARLRGEVYAASSGRLELPELEATPSARALLDSDQMRGVKLEGCKATVELQRQFEDLPYEKFGQVRLVARASASVGGGERVVRELAAGLELKTVLAGIPRPFDQTTLFVADAWSVTDFAEVNRRRETALGWVATLAREADEALALASPAAAAPYRKLRDFMPSAEELAERVEKLPESRPMALYAMGEEEQRYPLDVLDLASRLSEAHERASGPLQDAERALDRVRQAPADAAAHAELAERLTKALQAVQAALDPIWAFQEGFHFLTPSDERSGAVSTELARLGEAHWRRVASYVLRDRNGRAAAQELEELRSRLGTLDGVVLIESSAEPILLDGTWSGKLVLVVRDGRVVMRRTNAGAPEGSLLTVVSLGGTVEIEGRVEASVILAPGGAHPATLAMAAGAELAGSLVATRLEAQQASKGAIVCREQVRSGVTTERSTERARLDHYGVTFAPEFAYRTVTRR